MKSKKEKTDFIFNQTEGKLAFSEKKKEKKQKNKRVKVAEKPTDDDGQEEFLDLDDNEIKQSSKKVAVDSESNIPAFVSLIHLETLKRISHHDENCRNSF